MAAVLAADLFNSAWIDENWGWESLSVTTAAGSPELGGATHYAAEPAHVGCTVCRFVQ